VVDTGYVKLVVLVNKDDKLEFSFNAKAMNAILSGLAEEKFVKFMHLGTAKEMWDKLINNLLDTPTTLRGGVNECGALFPKTSLLHKNSSISIQHLFITHCFHL
jgi:hypothetical protein